MDDLEDLGDLVGGAAAAGLAGAATQIVGAALFHFLPDFVLRWVLTAAGVAIGAYLLFGDGAIDGGTGDIAGAALIVGSPILLILLPRWWHNI